MKKIWILTFLLGVLTILSSCINPPIETTDEMKVNQAKSKLNITFQEGDSENQVTKNLILPDVIGEVSVTWTSNKDDIINNQGIVVRPFDIDQVVTLTATLNLNLVSDSKIYNLVVIHVDEEYDVNKRNPLNENEIPYSFEPKTSYQNPIQINGQWGNGSENQYAYGIGDPFVMRFNGKYYLYPSTQDGQPGIKVYESTDMVNWSYQGYAVLESEESSRGAYAPEVIYYQGNFYLTQSKGGSGHFIYRADNPLGPFVRITGNLGRGIDGSFHINDDGKLYLMHTGVPAGLRMSEVLNLPLELDENSVGVLGTQRIMEQASLNHWIEGPGIIRRNGISFLTYTGNHVVSIAYRIAYSYTMGNLFGHQDFIQPANNVTLISTKSDYSGLGHSSNVFGPNLDSIYTAYHSRDQYGRRYNLDRYLTNGIRLTSNGAFNHFGTIPNRPEFEAINQNDFDQPLSGVYLSSDATESFFTAEYNYIQNTGAILLNYQDASNYLKLTINQNTDEISLSEIKDNVTSILKKESLGDNNQYNRLTVIRIEKSLSKFRIFFNGMLKLETDYQGLGGKIGYIGDVEIGYTAFTNDVNGSSDFEVVHGVPGNIPAQTYLKTEDRGFHFYGENLTNDEIRNGEKNNIVYKNNQYGVRLNTKEDYVKYPVEAIKNDYSLVAEITKDSLGSEIEVIINEETIIKVDIPVDITFPEGVEYLPVHLTNLHLDGESIIKFRLYRGTFEFRQFQLYEHGQSTNFEDLSGAELLANTIKKGAGNYQVDGDAIVSNNSQIFMGLLGDGGATNFEFSVDVALLSSGIADGGIVFRAKNYSYHPDQPTQSFQGYYLKLQERAGTFYKYDYGSTTIQSIALIDQENQSLFTQGTFNRIRVVAYHNQIQIYINDRIYLDVFLSDQLMDGQIGFFSRNTAFAYKNVSYLPLE